jgi:hypothetical protein
LRADKNEGDEGDAQPDAKDSIDFAFVAHREFLSTVAMMMDAQPTNGVDPDQTPCNGRRRKR